MPSHISAARYKKRKGLCNTSQTYPISPELLLKMRRLLDFHKPADLVLWPAYLTAFITLLWKSNLLPTSVHTINASLHPCRQNLREFHQGFTLTAKSTKTIQSMERLLQLPFPCIPHHPFCPATAIVAVRSLQPHSAPLFAHPNVHGMQLMTHAVFMRRLQSSRYGTHSNRRGGESWALQVGLPGNAIQILGDWHSNCDMCSPATYPPTNDTTLLSLGINCNAISGYRTCR